MTICLLSILTLLKNATARRSIGGCNSRAPPMRCIAIGKRYIVEFKNGSLKETLGKRLNPKDDEELGINLGQRDALIEKCKDSVLICSDLWGKRTRWFREHCVFVLVYNEDKNKTALKRVASSIRKKARFGLPDKLKGFCVKDVLTLTEKEFSTSLLSTWRDAEEIAEVDA